MLIPGSLQSLTGVYNFCNAMCERIVLQDTATGVDLQMHEMYFSAAEGTLRYIGDYQIPTPAEAAVLADLISHTYETCADIGAFPAHEVVAILLDKLIGATPTECQLSDELQ